MFSKETFQLATAKLGKQQTNVSLYQHNKVWTFQKNDLIRLEADRCITYNYSCNGSFHLSPVSHGQISKILCDSLNMP